MKILLISCWTFFASLLISCSSDNRNQYWDDGSPKILFSKIKIGRDTFTIKKYFYKGSLDSLKFYKRERFYGNGQIEKVEYFDKKGLPMGEWKSWFRNGQLSMVEHYMEGKRFGEYESWLPDGSPNEKFMYHNDSIINTSVIKASKSKLHNP